MKLPESFQDLFLNYEFSQMDTQSHPQTIIQRVLSYGDWEQIEWLFQHYGRERVQEIFLLDYYGYQTLPDPTRRLWEICFLSDTVRDGKRKEQWVCRRDPQGSIER